VGVKHLDHLPGTSHLLIEFLQLPYPLSHFLSYFPEGGLFLIISLYIYGPLVLFRTHLPPYTALQFVVRIEGMLSTVSLADREEVLWSLRITLHAPGVFRGALDAGLTWLAGLGEWGIQGCVEFSFVKYIFRLRSHPRTSTYSAGVFLYIFFTISRLMMALNQVGFRMY